ncbi:MAG: HAD family hydrolase [Prevotella sp.]|nr:HAD family hydrolase [Prevotella sp.]
MSKTYIFDYGGTLDTGGNHWGQVMWHAYERAHVPVTEEQFREAYVFTERTLGRRPIIQSDYTFRRTLEMKLRIQMEHLVGQGYWYAAPLELSQRQSEVLEDLYALTISQTAKSREVLKRLKEDNRLALVSNFYGNLSEVLREFGFDDIFEVVVESAVVGVRKPDPAIYRLALEQLALDNLTEVTVVGDSMKNDIVPAHTLGLKTILIEGEQWDSAYATDIRPDKVISRLDEIE